MQAYAASILRLLAEVGNSPWLPVMIGQDLSLPRPARLRQSLRVCGAVFTLLGALLFPTRCGAATAELHIVEGAGAWKAFAYGEQREDHPITFRVGVAGTNRSEWLIDFAYPNQYVDRFISRPLGSNIVTAACYKREHTQQINGYAFVEKASIPRGDGYLPLSALWLAFCARPTLEMLRTNRISPPYFKDGQAEKLGYSATVPFEVAWRDSNSQVFSSMWFLHDGKALNERRLWVRAPEPFDHGFTNAIFRVLSFAPGQPPGDDMPTEFALDYYYPFEGRQGDSYRLQLVQTCRLWVTNRFVTTSPGELFAELPSKLTYADRRFMGTDTPELRLAYTSDRFLSDREVQAMPAFNQAWRQQRALRSTGEVISSRTTARRGWVLLILALSLVGGIVLLAKTSKTRERKEMQ